MIKRFLLMVLLAASCSAATTNLVMIPIGGLYTNSSVDTNRWKSHWWTSSVWTNNPWTNPASSQTNVTLFNGASALPFLASDLTNVVNMGFIQTNGLFSATIWQGFDAANWNASNADFRLNNIEVGQTNSSIWIGPGPTNAGTGTFTGGGTQASPYVGDIDIIFSNAPNYADIHMLPGTYWKNITNTALKLGQHLTGSGEDITIIKRDPAYTNSGYVLYTLTNQVQVSDLTVDANAVGSTNNNSYAGVALEASYEIIQRVHAINCYGTNPFEMFCLDVGSFSTNYVSHNIIRDCWVSSIQGSYGAGIFNFGQQALILNNLVELPVMINAQPPFIYGYGTSLSDNSTFSHNTCIGGAIGFYTDSFWETNLTIAGNSFINGRVGIDFAKSSSGVTGLNIVDNFIDLDPTAKLFAGGIILWCTNGMFNVKIADNVIRFRDELQYSTNTGLVPAISFGTNVTSVATNPVNLKVIYNTFGTNMPWNTGLTNPIFTGNTDTTGLVLTNRP